MVSLGRDRLCYSKKQHQNLHSFTLPSLCLIHTMCSLRFPGWAGASLACVLPRSPRAMIRASVQKCHSRSRCIDPGVANYSPRASRLFFYTKFHRNMAAPAPVHTLCSCLHTTAAELSGCNRDYSAHKLTTRIYSLVLQAKVY